MSRATFVTISMSHPDDGTENYDRDISMVVRCTPGSKMHWPSPSCETGCPAEPAEFEVYSAIYMDDKSTVPESVVEMLDMDKIEEKASEMAAEKEEYSYE